MRVVVTGASGALGGYVLAALARRGHSVVALSGATVGERSGFPLRPVELTKHAEVASVLDEAVPDIVLHLAAISSAVECARDPDRAFAANVLATSNIASWCTWAGCRLVFTSTDLVFSGDAAPYREDDAADSQMTYGRLKRQGEESVLPCRGALVTRLPLMFGRSGKGLFDAAIADLAAGKPRAFFADEFRTPIDFASAAEALVRLAELGSSGIVHVAGAERVSRFELMRRAAVAIGHDPSLVRPSLRADVPQTEPRPADVSLDTTRLATLLPDLRRPTIEEALTGRSAWP